MTNEENKFLEIGSCVKNAVKSQMFGKPSFKIEGKAFVCFYNNCMVFKLSKSEHSIALNLQGSILFDPSDKSRPMKEWVQVTFDNFEFWERLAVASAKYVSSIEK